MKIIPQFHEENKKSTVILSKLPCFCGGERESLYELPFPTESEPSECGSDSEKEEGANGYEAVAARRLRNGVGFF